MKLSTKSRYAITAMMDLTIHYNNRPVTLTEISSQQSISISYLEQLFSTLRLSGLVQGVRGPGGGYRLGKTPNSISISDIIQSVEETDQKNSAKKVSDENNQKDYITQCLWNELSDQLFGFLNSISLADFIQDKVVIKKKFKVNDTAKTISSMFPVSDSLRVA